MSEESGSNKGSEKPDPMNRTDPLVKEGRQGLEGLEKRLVRDLDEVWKEAEERARRE